MNIHEELLKIPKNKRLLPIVGAGVSMSLKRKNGESAFPSWTKLLQNAAEALSKLGKPKIGKGIETFLDLEMYQDAANLAKSGFTGTLWGDFLSKELDIPLSEIDTKSLDLPKAIWGISNRIITLNFDKVLRYTCPDQSVSEIDNSQPAPINNFLRNANNKSYIWHLHGRIDNVSSLVFAKDGYSDLYESDANYNTAITALRNLSSTESFIFIGCSLSDAELLSEIGRVADIFEKNAGPHYALVHKNYVKDVKSKLSSLPFEIIEFEEFGTPLVDAIKYLSHTEANSESSSSTIEHQKETAKIAILSANPIEKRFNNTEILKNIKKLKLEQHILPLNVQTLNLLHEFTYVFILTTCQRGKLIIEDEWLNSLRLGVDEIIDNIDYTSIKGIFIFVDSFDIDPVDIRKIKSTLAPVAIYNQINKAEAACMGFKLKRKNTVKFTSDCIILNSERFKYDFEEIEVNEVHYRTSLPNLIDPKSLKGLVGRADDLANVVKKILEHKETSDVITIKGSGGIGKTSIVKQAAVDFSNRALFFNGISFIDCEFIKDFSTFQNQVGKVFGYQVDDLASVMREHSSRTDSLLILDNVESLLPLPDVKDIKSMIGFLSDFCTVVVTSRELLKLENEIVINIRRLTTDEAFELFCKEMQLNVLKGSDNESFVRERIIEDLLDNNPLAIKLVTRNTPISKDLRALHHELDQDIFSKTMEGEDSTPFIDPADRNVERKKSIYASINYSYKYLNDKEKAAFELLSLFPDGINMEAFKRISDQARITKKRDVKSENNPATQFMVTDATLRSLEGKSLIEIDNNTVYLQSLVWRFAETLFSKRSAVEIKRYRKNAFSYNLAIGKALAKLVDDGKLVADSVFHSYQKNFLKALSYAGSVGADSEDVCELILDVMQMAIRICNFHPVIKALNEANFGFPDESHENTCLKVIKLNLRYYSGDFLSAFSKLKSELPLKFLSELDNSSFVQRNIVVHACSIYAMEGYVLEAAPLIAKFTRHFAGYPDILFVLGEFDDYLVTNSSRDFFTFETAFAIGKLDMNEIDRYLDELHSHQYLERIQLNYLRVKAFKIPLNSIESLVVVNPFTAGIKDLIQALMSDDDSIIRSHYKSAIKKLNHIKYYFVEAHLLYARYLYSVGDIASYNDVYAAGANLAESLGYRYLNYCFKNIGEINLAQFDSYNYMIPEEAIEAMNEMKKMQIAYLAEWPIPFSSRVITPTQL